MWPCAWREKSSWRDRRSRVASALHQYGHGRRVCELGSLCDLASYYLAADYLVMNCQFGSWQVQSVNASCAFVLTGTKCTSLWWNKKGISLKDNLLSNGFCQTVLSEVKLTLEKRKCPSAFWWIHFNGCCVDLCSSGMGSGGFGYARIWDVCIPARLLQLQWFPACASSCQQEQLQKMIYCQWAWCVINCKQLKP